MAMSMSGAICCGRSACHICVGTEAESDVVDGGPCSSTFWDMTWWTASAVNLLSEVVLVGCFRVIEDFTFKCSDSKITSTTGVGLTATG